jgi:hypothetical protein
MKRVSMIAGALSALALAGGLALAAPGTARADVVPAGTWNEIVPAFTDQTACLDDPDGSATAGTVVQLYHCHGYASNGGPQRWVFTNVLEVGYRIGSHNLCLNSTLSLGSAPIELADCGRNPELWVLLSRNAFPGDPDVMLELTDDEQVFGCMSLPNFSGSNHEAVILEPCDSSNMLQYWVLD